MNVLFVASECTPFLKTGGLADVIGSLPIALKNTNQAQISVILPKYTQISKEFQEQMTTHKVLTVHVSWRKQYCGIQKLQYNGITYYFIDNEYYFKRGSAYGEYDDGERFTFFNHAVLEALPHLDDKPDIIHCHDWQTALIPAYIKTKYKDHPFYKNMKTVFTIHNLMYQGKFPTSIYHDLLHFDDQDYYGLEFDGCINFMKAAIVHAHALTTVSHTYATEIQNPYYGERLEGLLQERKSSLHGIINGIDDHEYDPSTDPNLYIKYKHNADKKVMNKIRLQEDLKLRVNKDIPMIAIVSRLVDQKGFSLVKLMIDDIAKLDIQLVILGTGDPEFEEAFKQAAKRYPDKISTHITFNESFARKIYAASDLFLMPSRFEPCGIGQLIALRYESVPIVRETGGLKDTVQSFNEFTEEGNGFSFTHYNAHDMLYTIRRAVSYYHNKSLWKSLLQNVYQSNFNWDVSARSYVELYKNIEGS